MIISKSDRELLTRRNIPYARADLLKASKAPLKFKVDSIGGYAEKVKNEIQIGLNDLAKIQSYEEKRFKFAPRLKVKVEKKNNIEESLINKDIYVWNKIDKNSFRNFDKIIKRIKQEGNTKFLISSMLALHRSSHKDPKKVIDFFENMSESSNIELAEWAKLFLVEMLSSLPSRKNIINENISERDFTYEPNNAFDITMPLIFSGYAYCKIFGTRLKIVITPMLFEKIFGKAMACVKQDSFYTKLIIEKKVEHLHPDGTPHYEIFPFSGHTEKITKNVFLHNYWANLSRPYYTSGKTELVRGGEHVIKDVKFSFSRVAETIAPDKYWFNKKPLVETVRGTFFGYGHINLKILLKNRFHMTSGQFQLTPKINPDTKKKSNIFFYGVFYGKLSDINNDKKLDINTIPVHCTPEGELDYYGDGSLSRDPYRPNDW